MIYLKLFDVYLAIQNRYRGWIYNLIFSSRSWKNIQLY